MLVLAVTAITDPLPEPFPPDDADLAPVEMLHPFPALITVYGERGLDALDQILGSVDGPADVVLRRDPVRCRMDDNRRDLGLGALGARDPWRPAGHRLGDRVAEAFSATDYGRRIAGRVAHGEFLIGEFPVLVQDARADTVLDRKRPDVPIALPRQRDKRVGVNPEAGIEPGRSLQHYRPVLAL